MTVLRRAATLEASPWHRIQARLSSPVRMFLLLAAFFGSVIAIITPPLFGPDEPAHLLRAYGLARGDFVPSLTDNEGRKGLLLPAEMVRDLYHFDSARERLREPGFNYRAVVDDFRNGRFAWQSSEDKPIFVPYTGSEGYSPAAYLPYVAAALFARPFDLGLLPTLYLMRLFGLIATTAMVAYAIGLMRHFGWAFLCIAMLPSALYARSVVSADGTALASAMVVTALCLRAATSSWPGRPWERSAWMTLCTLSKPPQLAFVALELMRGLRWGSWRSWARLIIVVVPAVVITFGWAAVSVADMGAWRLTESSGLPPEQFDPVWKLKYLLQHPTHFLGQMMGTMRAWNWLWHQLIGILGWLDAYLRPWVYPAVSLFLLASFPTRLMLDTATRLRVAIVAAIVVLGYSLAVLLVFYLGWTPIDSHQIEGVQGRYFVIALPPLALAVAALVNRGDPNVAALAALSGAVLSAAASIEAVLRVDWQAW